MSFWKSLLGQDESERDLQERIAFSFAGFGLSLAEAKDMARSCIEAAKEEARKQGSLPPNAGDTFLREEGTNQRVREWLAKKRREGVRNEDIRWYWNLDDLERRASENMYRAILYATWKDAMREGRTGEEAAVYARKFHPYYGEPDDTRVTSADDRPLPIELMGRENAWFDKQRSRNQDALKQLLQTHSSYNALMRAEIRAGRL